MTRSKILLVDDDPAVRASIAFSLGIEGFDVSTFAEAETVLEQGGIEEMDCIVLDQRLPGMDGLGLLARLRARGVRSPIIVITSTSSRRLRELVEEAGATLIEKPLLSGTLAAAIKVVVAGGRRAMP